MRGYKSYEVFSVLYKFKAGEVYNAGEFELTSKQIYSLNSVGGGRRYFNISPIAYDSYFQKCERSDGYRSDAFIVGLLPKGHFQVVEDKYL